MQYSKYRGIVAEQHYNTQPAESGLSGYTVSLMLRLEAVRIADRRSDIQ